MTGKSLVFLILMLTCLGGLLLPVRALALGEVPQVQATATPEEVIPMQDIPGDTLALLIMAGILALIVLGGVLWRSRK